MSGIIYVCGFYGAGKTTLIRAALDELAELRYLVTYVTRPPRPSELADKQAEYLFVTREEYERRRTASSHWDHTEVGGYFYGADAAAVNEYIQQDRWFIVAATSDEQKLSEMQERYVGRRFLVWIDTDADLANRRMIERDGEANAQRKLQDPTQTPQTAERMRVLADKVFLPTEDIEQNKAAFVECLKEILV